MLEEHQPRPYDSNESAGEPVQTPEQEQLVKSINRMFDKASKHRKKYDKDWINNYNMFRGRQWAKQRPSYRHSEVINFIFQAIQSMVPIMTDARPRIYFLPQEPEDIEFAGILNQLLESDWEKGGWLFKLTEILYDTHFYGIGYSSLLYDPEADYGMGKINYRSEDPFDMYPDPDTEGINENGDYFIKAKPECVEKLKKRYCKHPYVNFIKSDLEDLSSAKKTTELLHLRKNTDLDIANDYARYASEADAEGKDKALVMEVWLKPSDTEEKEVKNDSLEGEEAPVYVTKLKYPKGRRLVIINDLIFEDEHNPYDDGEFPYTRYVNYILPREFYGISEVEQLASPQKIFNKIVSFTLDVLTLMGNPVWIVDSSSGVDTRKLVSKPGLIIQKNKDSEVRREEGTRLQPYVFQLLDRLEGWFNGISGDQDISQGITQPGVTANAAIENLQNAAQTRVRQKMRNMDGSLTCVGRQYVSRALQFYETPRVFRLTNNENVQSFFKFHVERRPTQIINKLPDGTSAKVNKKLPDGTEEMETVANIRKYVENDEGKLVPENQDRQFIVRGSFDVKVNTASGLPFHKSETEVRVFKLFELGIIDEKEVLARLEYPNAEEILIRLEQKKQAEAQAAAQQQGVVNG